MKRCTLLLWMLCLLSCAEDANPTAKTSKAEVIDTKVKISSKEGFPDMENGAIVKLDEENNRYFVVIDRSVAYELETIKEIVCELESKISMDTDTKVSFFGALKWAGYKDDFFGENAPTYSEDDYTNWMNTHYQGEFIFGSRLYQTYPASDPGLKKIKNAIIPTCS